MKKQPHQKREFRKMRGVAMWLANDTCFNCDKKDPANHVHHVDHNPENNDLQNLVVLCEPCHILVHQTDYVPENLKAYYVLQSIKKLREKF